MGADINDCVNDIATLAQLSLKPSLITVDAADANDFKRVFLIHAAGLKAEDLTDKILWTLPTPQYRKGKVTLTSLASLIDFTNRMKEDSSVLFADADKKTLLAVMDYHEEVMAPTEHEAVPSKPALPRWGRFKALFSFPLSQPYKIWSATDKAAMSQGALASFLEDNIQDILLVDLVNDAKILNLVKQLGLKLGGPDELLAVARGFSMTAEEKFKSVVNMNTGEVKVAYEQNHNTNEIVQDIKLPTAFVLAIPIFEGDAHFQLLVRLKYRKADSSVKWLFDIYSIDKAFRFAFEEACNRVQEAVDLPLFYGSPAEAV